MVKATGIDENVDELMMAVAKETNYTMSDLMRMDIVRFFRIVESVRKAMAERIKSQQSESAVRSGRR